MTATATSAIVSCCNSGGAPLPGTQRWTCPTCKTEWSIAGFDDLAYGEEMILSPVAPSFAEEAAAMDKYELYAEVTNLEAEYIRTNRKPAGLKEFRIELLRRMSH